MNNGNRKNTDKDNSLNNLIYLVALWMADKSDYDKINYPDIEAGLKILKL